MSKAHQITCPHCGQAFHAEAVAQGRDLAEYLAILAAFGSYEATARDYIGLFASKPGAIMRVSTKLNYARELAKLWGSGQFKYYGTLYNVEKTVIARALHETVKRLCQKAGLKNHNYLKKILMQESQKGLSDGTRIDTFDADPPPPEDIDQRPVWEWELPTQAEALAMLYKSPESKKVEVPWLRRVEQNLINAGVDLHTFNHLVRCAESLKALKGKGQPLIDQASKKKGGPAPVGGALPQIGGRDG
jgi:hypothetical protein